MPVATPLACSSPPGCIAPSKGGRDSEGLLSQGLLTAPRIPSKPSRPGQCTHEPDRRVESANRLLTPAPPPPFSSLQKLSSCWVSIPNSLTVCLSGPPWLSPARLPDLLSARFRSITLLQCCWLSFIFLHTPSSFRVLALERTVPYAWTHVFGYSASTF